MKRTLTLLVSLAVAITASTASADFHLWLSPGGAGVEVSNTHGYPPPPPPPQQFYLLQSRPHHHHHDGKNFRKMQKKRFKEEMKMEKRFHKEMKKAHRRPHR